MKSGSFPCGDQALGWVSVTGQEGCKTSVKLNHVFHLREGPADGGICSGHFQIVKIFYCNLGLNFLFPSSSSCLIRSGGPSPSSGRTTVGMGTQCVPQLIFSLASALVPWCLAPPESRGDAWAGERRCGQGSPIGLLLKCPATGTCYMLDAPKVGPYVSPLGLP